MTVEPLRHRFDHGRGAEHADLHRTDREIAAHRVDLRGDESRRHHFDRGDALRVLRGQRGDRGCAIDAERRERLEVRLDAAAAAGSGAGDAERDRDRHNPTRARRPRSTMARNLRPAAAGSGARASAAITAMPSAPAAITSAALVSSMPAMAAIGMAGARARIASTNVRNPAAPIGGSGLSFELVAYTPPRPT